PRFPRAVSPFPDTTLFRSISMGVYGAMLATTSAGAMVAVERSRGWTRQLRLTPLTPVAYILLKACCAVVLGALSVAAVYLAGARSEEHTSELQSRFDLVCR